MKQFNEGNVLQRYFSKSLYANVFWLSTDSSLALHTNFTEPHS